MKPLSTRISFRRLGSLAALALLPAGAALAQTTGAVGIGTTTPDASALLDLSSTTKGLLLPRLTLTQRTALGTGTLAAPVAGLVIYQTDDTPGIYAYSGSAWVLLAADNLGNHTASQTFNLNSQRLTGSVGTSLGDSIAQVTLQSSVGTASNTLQTLSRFGAYYTRTLLSGYGMGPYGSNIDYAVWGNAYRSAGWGGIFTAGSPTHPLRWVGLAQNPGYNGTGSAIRIVDGTQGAGKVLTSDAQGYGTWQAPASTSDLTLTAPLKYTTNDADKIYFTQASGSNGSKLVHSAGWNLDYYAGPNNGQAGTHRFFTGTASGWQERLRIDASGNVGIGTTTPRGKLDVDGGGDTYFVDDPNTGTSQSVFMPGHLWLAPYSGSGGYAFVQARVPNSTSSTSLGLVLRTTNAGALINSLIINPDGAAFFAKSVTATSFSPSDQRLKQDVRPLGGALAAVQLLRGVRYRYRQDVPGHPLPQGEQVGVLAQEIERLYPELVTTAPDGYKAVNYAQLTPVLLEALKELTAEVATQRQRADRLEQQASQAATDHADLQTLKAQLTRLLGETPTAQAPR